MATGKREDPSPKEWTLAAIERGIRRLRSRIAELDELATSKTSRNDPKVRPLESEITATIEDVFGTGSRENREHPSVSLYYVFPTVPSLQEPDHIAEQQGFAEGIEETKEILRGLVRRLEEKIGDTIDVERVEVGLAASAELDELSLFRRSVFDRDLSERTTCPELSEEPLSLVMVDFDKFKAINDSHGHDAGDEVLKAGAILVTKIVGSKGRCYRYGGDELSILLPNYSADEAAAFAERVRRQIEALSIGSKALRVTASIGISEIPAHSTTPSDLFKMADKALYEAKNLGRNLVRIYGEPRPSAPGPRVTARKGPDPSGLTEAEAVKIRTAHFKPSLAHCPRDGSHLRISEWSSDEQRTPDLNIYCPFCGLTEKIPGLS